MTIDKNGVLSTPGKIRQDYVKRKMLKLYLGNQEQLENKTTNEIEMKKCRKIS